MKERKRVLPRRRKVLPRRDMQDGTSEVTLAHGETCLIDTKDYDALSEYGPWTFGKSATRFYVRAGARGTKMHRLVAELVIGKPLPNGAVVHHVNRDPLDNRHRNLVICQSQAYHASLHRAAHRAQGRRRLESMVRDWLGGVDADSRDVAMALHSLDEAGAIDRTARAEARREMEEVA